MIALYEVWNSAKNLTWSHYASKWSGASQGNIPKELAKENTQTDRQIKKTDAESAKCALTRNLWGSGLD
jgi:hypothetical protein